jgi:hypothetical protein
VIAAARERRQAPLAPEGNQIAKISHSAILLASLGARSTEPPILRVARQERRILLAHVAAASRIIALASIGSAERAMTSRT